MSKDKINQKEGFTIIEVVLVLAIAGLIFLMVFLALPALQRSQKDTQRKDQLSAMVTQIVNFQGNNKNRIPTCKGGNTIANCTIGVNTGTGEIDLTSTTGGGAASTVSDSWAGFYQNYLKANGDTFDDPNGGPYKLQIVDCTKPTTGTECATQRYTAKFESSEGGDDTKAPDSNAAGQNYWVLVTTHSSCDGEKVVYNAGARKVTVAYKLEGGGTFCVGN